MDLAKYWVGRIGIRKLHISNMSKMQSQEVSFLGTSKTGMDLSGGSLPKDKNQKRGHCPISRDMDELKSFLRLGQVTSNITKVRK